MYGFGYRYSPKGIYVPSGGGGAFDPDAQAFITAAAITDPIEQSAVNQLVVDMKDAAIWTKMKAVYPFVGGTATSHKWNLVNPIDSDAAFRLVFNGGLTHDSNGIKGNGTNGFADTKLNFNSLTSQNYSTSFYNNLNAIDSSAGGFVGAFGDSSNRFQAYYSNTSTYYYSRGTANLISVSGVKGFGGLSRESSANYYGVKYDGTYQPASPSGTGATSINKTIYLLSINGAALFSNLNMSFAHVGDGLTQAEMTLLRTAVINFQTTLSRA